MRRVILFLALASPVAVPMPAVLAAPAIAASQIACHYTYGGETHTLLASPATSPYTVEPVAVGSYFQLRVVFEVRPAEHAAVKIYTYADRDEGLVPIHVGQYSLKQAAAGGQGKGGFTGVQLVYEPVRDGELSYWCEMRAVPASEANAAHSAPRLRENFVSNAGTSKSAADIMKTASAAKSGTVNLMFVGDLMLDDGPGKVIARGDDPLAAFASVTSGADAVVGNLECPVGTRGKALDNKIWAFRAHPRVLPWLRRYFHGLSLANNHSGDFGKETFVETLEGLEQQGIPYFGGGRDLKAAHRPLWIERNGLRIAVLGYNEFKPRSFESGASRPGIAWSEDSQVIAGIRAARAAGADLVIPFMHWGWEREPQPSQRQRQLARAMIDAGADVVIGGHPHITQGAEYYRGRLIVYSLGNMVFDGFDSLPLRTGWVLRLALDRNGLKQWDTLEARMDDEGVPYPVSGARTPCGKAGDRRVRHCQNP